MLWVRVGLCCVSLRIYGHMGRKPRKKYHNLVSRDTYWWITSLMEYRYGKKISISSMKLEDSIFHLFVQRDAGCYFESKFGSLNGSRTECLLGFDICLHYFKFQWFKIQVLYLSFTAFEIQIKFNIQFHKKHIKNIYNYRLYRSLHSNSNTQ